jgi:hypothetical protein
MGDKKRNTKKEDADRLLTILFQKTLHSRYFAKQPFGSRANFEIMPNTILPLVELTWLHQLQEHFYEISDNKESGDWNVYGKYCAVRTKHVSKDFPLNNVHLMKANSSSLVKVESVTCIKPNGKHTKGVVKSLEEWAAKILCRDNNDYVRNIAKSDDKTKKCFRRTEKYGSIKYVMSETSYKPTEEETRDSVNIVRFTPQQQRNKTQEQLFLHVSNFMKDEIETLRKKAHKKYANQKDIKLLNCANKVAAYLVELVNKNCDEDFSTLDAMQEYMEEKAMNPKKKRADDSSEESSEEEEE